MNHRRKWLIALGTGALANPLASMAQPPPAKLRRIGFLSLSNPQSTAGWLTAFRAGMAELRWTEGRDYLIDARYGNGVASAGPGLADALLASGPDLLLVSGDTPTRLFAQRTKTIPIVFAIAQTPIGAGFAASLRRPGGNVTGLTAMTTELWPKRLQLLKEAFPWLTHAAMVFDPDDVGSVSQVKQIEAGAQRLKLRLSPVEVRQSADLEPAFKRAAALGAQAYVVTTSTANLTLRQAMADRIIGLKAPSMFAGSTYVEAGGLMSYAASFTDNFRRAAAYADKILKGAKPGDLPIEQPTRFELVVNLKTAKAIGVMLPATVLLQAERVIE